MKKAPKTPEAIKRGVRTMAILTIVVGVFVLLSGLMPLVLTPLLDWLSSLPINHHNPQQRQALQDMYLTLEASKASAWVMVPLAVVFVVAGYRARDASEGGVEALRKAAWLTVLAMLAGGAIWLWKGLELDARAPIYVMGVGGHLLQAWLVYRVAVYLGSEPVRAAVTGGPAPPG